jgi:hypothetical protein
MNRVGKKMRKEAKPRQAVFAGVFDLTLRRLR